MCRSITFDRNAQEIMKSQNSKSSRWPAISFSILVFSLWNYQQTCSFGLSRTKNSGIQTKNHIDYSSALFATKKKANKQSKTPAYTGFGGAAIEPCPCGSGLGYAKCCGSLHSDINVYRTATAEQVTRARYSAYAKRHVRKERSVFTYRIYIYVKET